MYIADLHIHSKYSRATSRDCVPEQLDFWARRKGIDSPCGIEFILILKVCPQGQGTKKGGMQKESGNGRPQSENRGMEQNFGHSYQEGKI